MSAILAPSETGYLRNVLFAVEVLDAVTLARITHGLTLTASATDAPPIVNYSGLFVWLDDGKPAAGRQITVDAGRLPYQGATIAAPAAPTRLVTIRLAPGRAYVYPPGLTVLSASLFESDTAPRVPLASVEVWLEWLGPGDSGTTWSAAPDRVRTDAEGFAKVPLHFRKDDEPARDKSGALLARVAASRNGSTGSLALEPLVEGRVSNLRHLAWDQFKP